jgi:proline-specific peptidase
LDTSVRKTQLQLLLFSVVAIHPPRKQGGILADETIKFDILEKSMPERLTNDIRIYYETHGSGKPLVFIHGGWVDHQMWNHQVEYFAQKYKVITYDVRGHGKTGGSEREKYSVELFADDLKSLLEDISIKQPAICGLSLGGMIAQAYAVKYPEDLKVLILADTVVSTELTLSDKIQKYLLAPKWLFLSIVNLLGMRGYTNFAFWFARITRGKQWFGMNEEAKKYVREQMYRFDTNEFSKIFSAIYNFTLQDLSKIRVPALIINGEYEEKSVFKHTEKMKELISDAQEVVIPKAGHVSNADNPQEFNRAVEEFLNDKFDST